MMVNVYPPADGSGLKTRTPEKSACPKSHPF